jgi:hypothetical protein
MSITERLRRHHPDLDALVLFFDENTSQAPLPRDLVVGLRAVAEEIIDLREADTRLDAPLASILSRLDGLVASVYRHAADLTVAQLTTFAPARRRDRDPEAHRASMRTRVRYILSEPRATADLAEGGGFEPPRVLPLNTDSSRAP